MNSICRKSTYYTVIRALVPDEKVPWNTCYSDYNPPYYSAPHLKKNCSYADPEIGENSEFKPEFNAIDNGVNRKSFDNNQPIQYIISDNYPLNPRGRTGLKGRGSLGRWGPNHAADAVVTRWKRSENMRKMLNLSTGLPILQFLAIMRKDCKKWAIPGGFVDLNEEVKTAMLRELFEEAIKMDKSCTQKLQDFFGTAKQVYKGYVDDPRNTDNAWIETTAFNMHDEDGDNTKNLNLDARDDAVGVKWIDINENMEIYPTHNDIIQSVNNMHLENCKQTVI